MSSRCGNIIPTEPGMPPIQCEEYTEFPGGMCDDCAYITAVMAMDGAHLIGHHTIPIATFPNGDMLEGTLYVAHQHGPSMFADL